MKVVIDSDKAGLPLRNYLIEYLKKKEIEVIYRDAENEELDSISCAKYAAGEILSGNAEKGIVIDEYGAGVFMAANKIPGIICAEVSEEHSAVMTRSHNNARLIALGSGTVGLRLAESICDAFVEADYDGGRHQIRVDMLDRLC